MKVRHEIRLRLDFYKVTWLILVETKVTLITLIINHYQNGNELRKLPKVKTIFSKYSQAC